MKHPPKPDRLTPAEIDALREHFRLVGDQIRAKRTAQGKPVAPDTDA